MSPFTNTGIRKQRCPKIRDNTRGYSGFGIGRSRGAITHSIIMVSYNRFIHGRRER